MLSSPIICGWQVYWLFSDDQRVKFIEKQVTEADTFDSDSVSSAAPSKEPGNCWVLLFFPYAARKKYIVLFTSSCKCFASYKRFFTDYDVESCCAKFLRQKSRLSLPSSPPKSAKHSSFAHAGDFAQSPIKQKSKGHNCPMLSVILFFALL